MKKEIVLKHLGVMLAGFLHALKCVAAAAMLAAGIFLFCCVSIESGYFAVGKFAAALLAIGIALLLFYSCGRDLQQGRFSK